MTATDSLVAGRLFDPTEIPLRLGYVSSLAARFTLPPFTQLDARSGWWKQRKQEWADLGIKSEIGRTARTFGGSGGKAEVFAKLLHEGRSFEEAMAESGVDETTAKTIAQATGQSIFDPVLCEMAYRWFMPPGGRVLDPFAGGSVRGIVAATLGIRYVGIDLSEEQCEANGQQDEDFQARRIYKPEVAPTWIVGDSREVLDTDGSDPDLDAEPFDLTWSCPPYHNLEVYSDDPRDLSNMDWKKFCLAYRDIIGMSVERLAMDRFAAIVVGEIRDPDGFYRHFVAETIDAFEAAGAAYYNEALLVTPAGTLPIRAAKQFVASRKLGRTHQTVLTFVKGNPKRAAAVCDPEVMTAFMGEQNGDDKDVDYSGMSHG